MKRKIKEQGDYDFGTHQAHTRKVEFDPDRTGEANLKVRMINNQGDNPLDEEVDGNQFDGMTDDYIQSMIDLFKAAPILATVPENMQWMNDAVAELQQRTKITSVDPEQEIDIAPALPTKPEVMIVMVNQDGQMVPYEIIKGGAFFTNAKNLISGRMDTFPTDQWKGMVLDNDDIFDSIPVGEHLEKWKNKEPIQEEPIQEEPSPFAHKKFDTATLERARSILNRSGITDTRLTNNDVDMTANGYKKLAKLIDGDVPEDQAASFCKSLFQKIGDMIEEKTK
jgi:hypothetical protein